MKKSILLFGLALLAACTDPGEDLTGAKTTKPTPVDAAGELREQAEGEQRRLQGLWSYHEVATEGGTQTSATIFSRTVEVGEGEFEPEPDAQLVLRDHPSWGRSAYLLLAQSKFDCGKPCELTVAFDKGDPQKYPGLQADSGKGPALFIEDETRFIDALKQAKLVRVVLPKGSGLVSSVSFEVGGYDTGKYH